MRSTYLILFLIFQVTALTAQPESIGVSHKHRTFGIGFFAGGGLALPLQVDDLGGEHFLDAALPILNDLPEILCSTDASRIESERYTLAIGAYAHYRHSFGSGLLFTLEGGYAKTQVAHYLINLEPFQFSSPSFSAFHDWYNYNHTFTGIQLGFPLNKRMDKFFNVGVRVSRATISESFFQKDLRAYGGILESGTHQWLSGNGDEGFLFSHFINDNVIILQPVLRYLVQFGKHKHHSFEIGFSYSLTRAENLIDSRYSLIKDGKIANSNEVGFNARHLAAEVTYTLPLIRSKKLKSASPNPIGGRHKQNQPLGQTPIRKDLKSCFKEKSVEKLNHQEKPLYFTDDEVEIEFYHHSKGNPPDGDRISVCLDGRILHKNITLSGKGETFSIKTRGKRAIRVLVYIENSGTDRQNSLGLALTNGGNPDKIELNAFPKQYYHFTLKRR